MNLSRHICRWFFDSLCTVGRSVGGIRPNKIYDLLGRHAYPEPVFTWHKNRWGAELSLSAAYHIDRNILLLGTYDLDIHLLLERYLKPGMICLDVGANLGEIAIHMAARVGDQGAVYAFEPVAFAYQRLRLNTEHNCLDAIIRTFPIALSNQTGQACLHFADSNADNQGLASIVHDKHSRLPCAETVPTMTLDDFVNDQKLPRIDLIKIDIQGAELMLLEGGAKVFREFAPDILIEISPDDLQATRQTSQDLVARIESYGYTVYAMKRGQVGARSPQLPSSLTTTRRTSGAQSEAEPEGCATLIRHPASQKPSRPR